MKILFSAVQYPTKDHPFAAFIGMMAEEMALRGHEVYIIAPQSITHSIFRNSKIRERYETVSKNQFRFPIKIYRPLTVTFGDNGIRGRWTLKWLQYSACRKLNNLKETFDICYSHFWQSAYQVLPYIRKKGVPLIVVSGEDVIKINDHLTECEIQELGSYCSRVIGVSTKNIKESQQKIKVSPNKSFVIPNGPDLRHFKPVNKSNARKLLGWNQDDFIITFIGRFIYRKGAKRVESAIERIDDPKIKSVFIGTTMKDEASSEEPNGKSIIYKGILTHQQIPLYLSASDVYVLPTLAEGCSNSIVEAMACGLPIISSDKDFNYDILDSTNSILVDPLNIDEISQAIINLRSSKELQKSMSEKSAFKARELSFEKRVDKIMAILKDVIDENHCI